MKAIIDQGIPNADRDFILKMGGVLLLLAAVGCVCAIFAQFFAVDRSNAKQWLRQIADHRNHLAGITTPEFMKALQ